MKHLLILLLCIASGGCLSDPSTPTVRPTLAQLQGCWLMDSTGIDSTESFRRALVCFRDSHFYMTRQFPHRDLGNTFRGIDDAESYGSATIVERGVELIGVTYYKKNPWNRVTSFKEFYELSIEEGGALMHRETERWNPRDSTYFFPPFSVAPKPSWW